MSLPRGYVWHPLEIERLKVLYPDHDDAEIATHFPNRSASAIYHKANHLRLRKSAEYLSRRHVRGAPLPPPAPRPVPPVFATAPDEPDDDAPVGSLDDAGTVIEMLEWLFQAGAYAGHQTRIRATLARLRATQTPSWWRRNAALSLQQWVDAILKGTFDHA